MTTHLLDTNTVSYVIKGHPPMVRRRLARMAIAHLAISAITEAELRYGFARLAQAHRLQKDAEQFRMRIAVPAWDSAAAQAYAELGTGLEKSGKTTAPLDLLIAAHALSLGLILVTHDHAFSRIPKLKVEDWTKPSR